MMNDCGETLSGLGAATTRGATTTGASTALSAPLARTLAGRGRDPQKSLILERPKIH